MQIKSLMTKLADSGIACSYRGDEDVWGVMLCVDSGTCGKDLGYVYAPTPPRVLC